MADQIVLDSGFKTWDPDQLPNLTGKTYLITGGNSGLGYETAKYLGKAGADIILACRSAEKAKSAVAELGMHTKGIVDFLSLDLSDLSSIRSAAEEVHSKYEKLDGLINNAGIMHTPHQKTTDGFEMQVGTNHLGHFLLSGLLLDLVEKASGRFVTLTSVAHKYAPPIFDDFMSEKKYSAIGAYSLSKLANIMFAFELDRRLNEFGCRAISIACHPGYANTNLQSTGPVGLLNLIYKLVNPLFAQPSELGSHPTVLAAAGSEAKRGGFYGPQKMFEFRGPAGDATAAAHALDQAAWKKLWDMSEDLVGFKWSFPASGSN